MVNKKRSDAAKKGWVTRRKNMAKKAAELAKQIAEAAVPDLSEARITEWFDDADMSEIYSSGLQFAFVSEDWKQCHQFAYCKDFLQDAVWAELHNKTASIYRFIHTPGKNPPVFMNKTRIAVRYKGQVGIKTLCQQSEKFLNALSKDMGFESNTLHFGGRYKDTPSSVFVFEGDKRWMYSPTLLSLYTLSLRVGLTYEGGPWRDHFSSAKSYKGENDSEYTSAATKALDKIVGKDISKVFAPTMVGNYPEDVSIHGMHDHSGIVSLGSNEINPGVKKHWSQQ